MTKQVTRPILILSALAEEQAELCEFLRERREDKWGEIPLVEGVIDGISVVIIRSGVGKVLATLTAQYAIDRYHPEALIMTGLAGTLRPELERGTVVVGRRLIQHDLRAEALGWQRGQIPYTDVRWIETPEALIDRALQYQERGMNLCAGNILTGDQFIYGGLPGREDVMQFAAEVEGDAIEMEGAAVAFVGSVNKIPTLVVRTISDSADADAPTDFLSFLEQASERSARYIRWLVATKFYAR
mgnify:CR=1 FL=1